MMTETDLLELMTRLDMRYEVHRHPPLHTVEQSRKLRGDLPGLHVKNMFLKGKKGDLWLVTCLEDRQLKITDLQKAIGASRLSFGAAELMEDLLGVAPGSVTPLAVVNDAERKIGLVVDTALADAAIVNCHPLHNEATVRIDGEMAQGDGLAKFFAHTGHAPQMVDFDALAALKAAADAGKTG